MSSETKNTKIFDGTTEKGEIWNIELGKTSSTGTEIWAGRPAVIVSNEATNKKDRELIEKIKNHPKTPDTVVADIEIKKIY